MHSMKLNHPILITETDGNIPDEFVYVKSTEKNQVLRLRSSLRTTKNFSTKCSEVLKDIFLPRGYPNSVSKDYLNYQLWDTLQACCSTITSTLATRAILQGLGVGDNTANSVSAAITWVMKDGVGMLAKILFAWIVGSGLDADCKKWRMFADIINDIAICTELIILPFCTEYSLFILCLSTSLRGLVGIAGGATRAAITQHQAIQENMADVSAKDGSQETCVNLVASIIGIGILSTISSMSVLWYVFMALTYLHLYANFKAVKSLNFTYFNDERLVIFLKEYLMMDLVLPPQEINKRESVFIGMGEFVELGVPIISDTNLNLSNLNFQDYNICGHTIKLGCSIEKLTKKNYILPFQIQFLAHLYRGRKFMVILCEKENSIYVALDAKCSSEDVLEAYFHAMILGIAVSYIKSFPISNLKKNYGKEDSYKDPYKNVHTSVLKKLTEALGQKQREYYETKWIDFSVIMTVDQIASQNVGQFKTKCSLMGWNMHKNILQVNKWRSYWGDQRNVEISDSLKVKEV